MGILDLGLANTQKSQVCLWRKFCATVYNIPSVKALEKKMKPPCLPHIPPEWKCFGFWKLKHIFKARTSQWDDNETTWRMPSVEHSSVMHLMVNAVRDPEKVSKPIPKECLYAKGKLRLGLSTVQLWELTATLSH